MIHVVFADDEEIIRRGIQHLIPFEKLNMHLDFVAKNGRQALDYLLAHPVDILITDIKMPLLDGIELIQAAYAHDPSMRFILLTGYGDFEYAKTAMKYGVRHYLLKPCEEIQLMEALSQIQTELANRIPQKRERETLNGLLMRFLSQGACSPDDMAYCTRKLCPDQKSLCLVSVRPDGPPDGLTLFAAQNIAEEIFLPYEEVHSLVWNENLLLFTALAPKLVEDLLRDTLQAYKKLFCQELFITVSSPGTVNDLPALYQETASNGVYHYYSPSGSILTPDVVRSLPAQVQDPPLPCLSSLTDAVLQLQPQKAAEALSELFATLSDMKLSVSDTRRHILSVYFAILRLSRRNGQSADPGIIERLMTETLQDSHEILSGCIRDLISQNEVLLLMEEQDVIARIRKIIDENLGNPELSLKWIARQIYMNENYLGKLFYKQTGCKFSHYLTGQRMAKAISLIQENPRIKTLSLCEALGFQNNPAYFSTLFKSNTGMTISAYRKQFLPKEDN